MISQLWDWLFDLFCWRGVTKTTLLCGVWFSGTEIVLAMCGWGFSSSCYRTKSFFTSPGIWNSDVAWKFLNSLGWGAVASLLEGVCVGRMSWMGISSFWKGHIHLEITLFLLDRSIPSLPLIPYRFFYYCSQLLLSEVWKVFWHLSNLLPFCTSTTKWSLVCCGGWIYGILEY